MVCERTTRWAMRAAAIALIGFLGWGTGAARGAEPARLNGSFAVPDGPPSALFSFITKMRQLHPPQDASPAAKQEFLVKSHTAIVEAADKILATRPSGLMRTSAIKAKIDALVALDKATSDGKAHQKLGELANEFKDEKQADVVRLVKPFIGFATDGVVAKDAAAAKDVAKEAPPAKAAEIPKTWDELKPKLAAAPEDRELVKQALALATVLERSGRSEDAALAYAELSAIVEKSKDPQIAALAKMFGGTIRRLTLMGKKIDFSGKLIDGTPVDAAALKDKVVLIDFWATWCPPCRAELPNVLRNYEKYHSKGFEVLGVSVDQDKDALKKFVAEQKIPWPIVFGKPPQGPPMANYYGISAVPTAILTNQKGDVISLDARGPELTRKLEELLDQ
jgi:thiol-disulfide isomerase/thioredoxin